MQSRCVAGGDGAARTFVAILAPGEEAKRTLLKLARQEELTAASFVALGAFGQAVVGYFDWQQKEYRPIPIDEQVEVIRLVGDFAVDDSGEIGLHAHTVLGRADGTTRGGHLIEGHVRPTLEVTITETPAHLRRRKRTGLGVALINID